MMIARAIVKNDYSMNQLKETTALHLTKPKAPIPWRILWPYRSKYLTTYSIPIS